MAGDPRSEPLQPETLRPRAGSGIARSSIPLRVAGFIVGIAGLAAAVWIAMREREGFVAALKALRDPPPLDVGVLLLAILAATALTAALFVLLFRRFGRIAFAEMFTIVAAASFVNYLPLKPGFAGRVVYHRIRHGIRATDTVRTMIEAIALSGAVSALLLGGVVALRACGLPAGAAVLAPALAAGAAFLTPARPLALPLLVRSAEFALLAGRYWLVFRLVGSPVDLDAAIVLACVGALATLVPFVSGALGVREWLTGLVTPLVSSEDFAAGVVAELVHRVAELVVLAPLGLASTIVLARRARRTKA